MTADEVRLEVVTPYRLDLTVAVLRRLATNVVDVVRSDGTYVRALGEGANPAVVAVRRIDDGVLGVRVSRAGERGAAAEGARVLDVGPAIALVRRMLGTERTLLEFERGATRIAWLRDLALRMRGIKPPRYATLWEACVNAIVFQQVSIFAAAAILRRTIESLGQPLLFEGVMLHAFPGPGALLSVSDAVLRTAGLSAAKIATLRRIAAALEDGRLDETSLERETTEAAAAALCGIKGIGPWTAAVILLRGLGRLDLFPGNDSGVARSIASLGSAASDIPAALELLGAERGMLYYHLLLARLEARGDI